MGDACQPGPPTRTPAARGGPPGEQGAGEQPPLVPTLARQGAGPPGTSRRPADPGEPACRMEQGHYHQAAPEPLTREIVRYNKMMIRAPRFGVICHAALGSKGPALLSPSGIAEGWHLSWGLRQALCLFGGGVLAGCGGRAAGTAAFSQPSPPASCRPARLPSPRRWGPGGLSSLSVTVAPGLAALHRRYRGRRPRQSDGNPGPKLLVWKPRLFPARQQPAGWGPGAEPGRGGRGQGTPAEAAAELPARTPGTSEARWPGECVRRAGLGFGRREPGSMLACAACSEPASSGVNVEIGEHTSTSTVLGTKPVSPLRERHFVVCGVADKRRWWHSGLGGRLHPRVAQVVGGG